MGSELSVTPVLEGLVPSSGLCEHARHTCIYASKYTSINDIFKTDMFLGSKTKFLAGQSYQT